MRRGGGRVVGEEEDSIHIILPIFLFRKCVWWTLNDFLLKINRDYGRLYEGHEWNLHFYHFEVYFCVIWRYKKKYMLEVHMNEITQYIGLAKTNKH